MVQRVVDKIIRLRGMKARHTEVRRSLPRHLLSGAPKKRNPVDSQVARVKNMLKFETMIDVEGSKPGKDAIAAEILL